MVPEKRVSKEETLSTSPSKSSFKYFVGLELGYGFQNESVTTELVNGTTISVDDTNDASSTYGLVGGFIFHDNHKFTFTYNKYSTDDGMDVEYLTGVNPVDLGNAANLVLDTGLEFTNLSIKNLLIDFGIREMYIDNEKTYSMGGQNSITSTDVELTSMPKVYLDISYVF